MANKPQEPIDGRPEGAIEQKYSAALDGMRNLPFLKTAKYQEQQFRANREGAHPKIVEFADQLVKRMKLVGVPMFPHCIVRTPADQDAAYALGHSRIRGNGDYPHRAFAVDIIHGIKGWNLTEKQWALVGHLGFEVAKKVGVTVVWGGDWDGDGDIHDQKLYDPAHWEIAFWRSIEPQEPWMTKPSRLAEFHRR